VCVFGHNPTAPNPGDHLMSMFSTATQVLPEFCGFIQAFHEFVHKVLNGCFTGWNQSVCKHAWSSV